jgi:hypothetical protein
MSISVKGEFREALMQFLLQLEKEIIQNSIQAGQVASGKTIQSFEVEVNDHRGILRAAPHLMALENGRGPTKVWVKKESTLFEKIKEWLWYKFKIPLRTKHNSRLAYIITRKIHAEGTRLYRMGGRSGVVSNVITDQRIEAFLRTYATKFSAHIRSEVYAEVNRR